MILREPGTVVERTLPHEADLPLAERAKFYMRVLTDGEYAETVDLKEQVDSGEIDEPEFLARLIGMALERVSGIEVLGADGERAPLEVERRPDEQALTARMVGLLYPFAGDIVGWVQRSGVVTEGEQKNC